MNEPRDEGKRSTLSLKGRGICDRLGATERGTVRVRHRLLSLRFALSLSP